MPCDRIATLGNGDAVCLFSVVTFKIKLRQISGVMVMFFEMSASGKWMSNICKALI